MYVNYRYKRKERDVAGTDGKVILPTYQHSLRYRLTYSPDHLQLRTTVDYNHFHSQGQEGSQGYQFTQSCSYAFSFPIKISVQGTYFHTDDYDSRIYASEKGLLYTFYTPSFYGQGFRFSACVRYDVNKVFMFLVNCQIVNKMTVIYPSPIFGPVHSRRLGVSLGINLLPEDGKVCSFDCIYCECGFNADHRPKKALPTREEVRDALEARLQDMQQNGPQPDVLTFAGNGEPTAHPHFPEIIEDTLMLRDKYFPNAKVSVLSNSTFIHRPAVFDALNKIDNNILKLDTVDEDYIHTVDRPTGHYSIDEIIEHMKAFQGNCIIQTMFMKGSYQGKDVDNTSDKYVLPWLEVVKEIKPRQVMIYTIDRETPDHDLCKATHEELDRIASLIKEEGLPVSVSY